MPVFHIHSTFLHCSHFLHTSQSSTTCHIHRSIHTAHPLFFCSLQCFAFLHRPAVPVLTPLEQLAASHIPQHPTSETQRHTLQECLKVKYILKNYLEIYMIESYFTTYWYASCFKCMVKDMSVTYWHLLNRLSIRLIFQCNKKSREWTTQKWCAWTLKTKVIWLSTASPSPTPLPHSYSQFFLHGYQQHYNSCFTSWISWLVCCLFVSMFTNQYYFAVTWAKPMTLFNRLTHCVGLLHITWPAVKWCTWTNVKCNTAVTLQYLGTDKSG